VFHVLSEIFRALAESTPSSAPEHIETALLREFRRRKRIRRFGWLAAAGIAAGLTLWLAGPRVREVQPMPRSQDARFLLLPNADTPFEYGAVIRVELPRSALVKVGLPVNEDRFPEPVKADVLIGQDGVARAVRFVP
jgi:hypothetical protein